MYPTLGDLLGRDLPIGTHEFFVGLGVALALLALGLRLLRTGAGRDERMVWIVVGALLGGAVWMRLGTWVQTFELRDNATLAEQWLYGNRSIMGGLLGAWLGVHVAKRLTGYRTRTGDLFAPAVALGMAVGRWGCHLTELPGTPNPLGWGPVLDAETAQRLGGVPGVSLHASLLYESAFHLVALVLICWSLWRRRLPQGETFVLYIAGYALFRFAVEFVRGNEVVWWGLTRPQWVLLAVIPVILLRIAWQVRHGVYARPPVAPAPPASLAGAVEPGAVTAPSPSGQVAR